MSLRHWNVSFDVQNSQRRYPLAPVTSARDTSDSFQLPDDFLLGLWLAIHYAHDVEIGNFLLYQLSVYATGFGLTVGYDDGGTIVPVATTSFNRHTHVPGNVYSLFGVNDFHDAYGDVSVGRLESIDQQPGGVFVFDRTGALLDADTIRPSIRAVQALYVRNGDEVSHALVGDVELVAQRDMVITPVIVEGERTKILFSAVSGEGLNSSCLCNGIEASDPIRQVNEIRPTPAGDFFVLGDDGIEVVPINNGILLRNKYTPCCDCEELTVVTSDLQLILQRLSLVEGFANRLTDSTQQFNTTVLGSRLSDQSCEVC
jgi:hypothetical protein